MPTVDQLGHGQVVAVAGRGARAHRGAEAGTGGCPALGRHHERAVAAGRVAVVGDGTVPENPVEDAERGQLAGAGPDDGDGLGGGGGLGQGHLAIGDRGAPHDFLGHEELRLHRGGTHSPAEQLRPLALLQPVAAGLLMIVPTFRKVVSAGHLTVDDRPVSDNRAHGPVASGPELLDQGIEAGTVDDRLVTNFHGASLQPQHALSRPRGHGAEWRAARFGGAPDRPFLRAPPLRLSRCLLHCGSGIEGSLIPQGAGAPALPRGRPAR